MSALLISVWNLLPVIHTNFAAFAVVVAASAEKHDPYAIFSYSFWRYYWCNDYVNRIRLWKHGEVILIYIRKTVLNSTDELAIWIHLKLLHTLQWRHNGRDSVSDHQPHDCLLNRLFRRRSKKTSKLRVTGLCAGIHRWPFNSPHKWPVTRKYFHLIALSSNKNKANNNKTMHIFHGMYRVIAPK